MTPSDIRTRLLDVALELVQTRGYNAFSYRDLADRVGITTASIHYHFRTKADLGVALVRRQRQACAEGLAPSNADDARAMLRRYADFLREALDGCNRMCLGGMLATEHETLAPELQAEVRGYFEDHERHLAAVLAGGRNDGVLTFAGEPAEAARGLFAALEGAMLLARTFHDPKRYDETTARLLAPFFA